MAVVRPACAQERRADRRCLVRRRDRRWAHRLGAENVEIPCGTAARSTFSPSTGENVDFAGSSVARSTFSPAQRRDRIADREEIDVLRREAAQRRVGGPIAPTLDVLRPRRALLSMLPLKFAPPTASARQAAFSSSFACRRAATSPASAPSIRTSSPTTAARSSCVTVVRAGSADVSLTIVKWRSASEAICGRWVMQMTWRPAGEDAELIADRARGLAADAGVDLVEDERRRPRLGGDAHEREHHARELAARRGVAQRPGRDAGVRARS